MKAKKERGLKKLVKKTHVLYSTFDLLTFEPLDL